MCETCSPSPRHYFWKNVFCSILYGLFYILSNIPFAGIFYLILLAYGNKLNLTKWIFFFWKFLFNYALVPRTWPSQLHEPASWLFHAEHNIQLFYTIYYGLSHIHNMSFGLSVFCTIGETKSQVVCSAFSRFMGILAHNILFFLHTASLNNNNNK